ncbi:MAG: D-alanyl-D-alanine carboxypeptidase [Clostridium sp.]|nr:D-alanyl-D-alanine carboxypeptidase [Clostridium sp.]MCM1399504.1 D-alanyl-D-alanine carboxypeptidase [Clostridium sp.]MCM1460058.1 D-alanyl-D-alanine carboxypeptidase [Bacteroides sp.]
MKKIICFLLLMIMILVEIPTASVYAEEKKKEDVTIESKSAILMEASTGQILYEKNADEPLRPASVTKIMTLLLIFQEISEGNMTCEDIVTVSEHAASMGGSQCFFEEGEQQTVGDMIKCIEVASGNDAATAMAEHIAGTEDAFVNMMNDKAAELGMKNTHFVNCCGLEAEGHLTTARDIAIMSRELTVKYPDIFNYSTIWMDSIIHKTRRGESKFDLANTNKFLRTYTGATGLKTGYTSQAKYCMSATASRNGINLISVIMGAETKEKRNSEAGKLLDYGFAKCSVYCDTEGLPSDVEFPVKLGSSKNVTPQDIEDVQLVIVDGATDSIEKNVIVREDICAPVKEGDTIGMIQYKSGEQVVGEVLIYAACDVPKSSYKFCFKKMCRKLFLLSEE